MSRRIHQQTIFDDREQAFVLRNRVHGNPAFLLTGVMRGDLPDEPHLHAASYGRTLLFLGDWTNSGLLILYLSIALGAPLGFLTVSVLVSANSLVWSVLAAAGAIAGVAACGLACIGILHLRLAELRSQLVGLPPVCLACTRDLTGVPPQDDGCTVCPECGAAWRLAPKSDL